MKVLVFSLAVGFAFVGLPALASAAPADSFGSAISSDGSSCRAKKKKDKKQAADSKGKKKGKEEKKPYGFEL
jgi:hypothetical protein